MRLFGLLIFLLLILAGNRIKAAESPYPIIFVHGLNSDDQTWSTVLTQISPAWNMNSNHTLHFVLNARGGDTTNYLLDVINPLRDNSGNVVNVIGESSIYSVNFGNFWNRNPADQRILLYNNTTPGSSQSPSNQSAIYKQAYALSIAIDSVLRKTGAEKVILVGHSMGGLAIREYLQRREGGLHKWWINPLDTLNGHKVAKVVTTGSPHLGTNVTSIPLLTIDNNSEAMRDMRITYTSGQNGAYLFTNNESNVTTNFYNNDINCNSLSGDDITGLSSGNSFNALIPLPVNLTYTYITSNYLGFGTDLAVSTNRQWLYSGSTPMPAGIADTLFNTRSHLQQTSDTRSIIRGLDEPDKRDFAYGVSFDKSYSAYVTAQSNGSTSDTDFYKVDAVSGGVLKLKLNSVSAGVGSFALLSSSGAVMASKSYSGNSDSLSALVSQDTYFVRIIGNSNQNTNLNYHNFTLEFTPALRLNLYANIEGMWNGAVQANDTVRVFLRSSASPYAKVDSAFAVLNNSGYGYFEFMNAQQGNYFLQTKHRNALETWSASSIFLGNAAPVSYDFTEDQARAFGGNTVLKSGEWCFFSGDVISDGAIDASDLAVIDNDAFAFSTGYLNTDLDGNNFIDATDYAIADNNAYNFVTLIRP
jgi:pimeloyl-ACP methyl ester carboxylesterase